MQTISTVVHLIADPSRNLADLPTADDYQRYFFDVQSGVAGFWLQQTNYQLLLTGVAQPWVTLPYSSVQNSRLGTIAEYINTFTSAWTGGLTPAQLHVIVDAAPLQRPDDEHPSPWPIGIDAGAAAMFIVISAGDAFDFVAHEVGHAAFGLQHSFDRSATVHSKDARPGEYGHPYCIMSAQTFGNREMNDAEPPGFAGVSGYKGYGPGLSVATRVSKGWATSTAVTPSVSRQDFEIAAANRASGSRPQALEISGANGSRFLVSYRTNADTFDRMLMQAAIVVEQLDGGLAEANYPGKSCATFIGEIRLPIQIGSASSSVFCPGFTVQVTDWDVDPNSQSFATVGIIAGARSQLDFGILPPTTVEQEVVDKGHASFAKGEVTCVAGEYDWLVTSTRQKVIAYVKVDGLNVGYDWKLNGIALQQQKGSVRAGHVPCRDYPPIPDGQLMSKTVEIDYELLSTGEITLSNSKPSQGSFQVTLQAQVTAKWFTAPLSIALRVSFQGSALVIPQLEKDRIACAIKNLDLQKHSQRRVLLLPGDLWRRMPPEEVKRGQELMDGMTRAESTSSPSYKEDERALARLVGRPGHAFEVHELSVGHDS